MILMIFFSKSLYLTGCHGNINDNFSKKISASQKA